MTAPDRTTWKSFWMGLAAGSAHDGWFPNIAEIRNSQTLVFDRRLTIGPADLDSDELISTLSMGDWTGGGQIEEMSGADQSRYWWGVFDNLSPRQAALPPLVLSGKPSGATGTCYPLGVVNDTMYFSFGTDICGLDEGNTTTSALAWYTKETMTTAPSGKATSFNGALYVPHGATGYSVITESGTGNPIVTAVAGAADPTSNAGPPTTNPRPVAFCVYQGSKLFALTATGGIAWTLTGASGAWNWDYDDALGAFPKLETSKVPKRLIAFFNKAGVPTLFATHSRGSDMYNRNLARFEETPIQFPQHPDVGLAAAVWRSGEDLWIAMGLDTVHWTAANVGVPLSGVNRDAGLPQEYRGRIVDLEPGISALYALVSPIAESTTTIAYSAEFGTTGSGNANLDTPKQIAIDSSGDIYVADFANDRLKRHSSVGTFEANLVTSLDEVTGVCVDASLNVYVSFKQAVSQYTIRKYNSAGTLQWTSALVSGVSMGHLATDGTSVFITIPAGPAFPVYRVDCATGATAATVSAFGTGDGQFTTPYGIAYSAITGNLYVVDQGNDRVQEITTTGTFVRKWGSSGTGSGQFTTATGIAIHPSTGDVFVADSGRDDVQQFSSSGLYLRTFGASGTGNGQFTNPDGIAMNGAATGIWVGDADQDNVQQFSYGSSVTADTTYAHVQAWSGTGWGGNWADTVPGNVPTVMVASSTASAYRLSWGMDDGNAYTQKLPRSIHNPRQAILGQLRNFASSGYVETSRADMGMLGFKKIASHVIVFMRHAAVNPITLVGETMTVYYDVDDGGWELLGQVTTSGRSVLEFQSANITGSETVSRGLAFQRIRFRLEFARGADVTQSPVLHAFNLHFLKVPQSSITLELVVPLPKRLYRGRGPQAIDDALTFFGEADEMVFVRHRERLLRMRISQITGTDSTGEDYSGMRTVRLVEIPTNAEP